MMRRHILGLLSGNAAWTIALAVLSVAAAGLPLTGHGVATNSLVLLGFGVTGLAAPLLLPRYRHEHRLSKTLLGAALLLMFSAAAAVLSYLVVSTNAPLVDETLAAWDRALGFDWIAFSAWLHDWPALKAIFDVAYMSGLPQLAVVVVFLGISGRHARLDEFLRLYFVATLLAIVVSGPFPAAGPWKYYGVDGAVFDLLSQSHFELLRQGAMRDIPIGLGTQGLISMPSLHAAMAVLLAHAMRGTALFRVFAVLNVVMLLSTPVSGSHYLVDVIAGLGLAACLIMLSQASLLRVNIASGGRPTVVP